MTAWDGIETAASEHSSLFEWMAKHHDQLDRMFSGQRVRWAEVAKVVAAEGLTDRTGKPPVPATVKKTWFRVRRFIATRRAKAAAKHPATPLPRPARQEPVPAVRDVPKPSEPVRPGEENPFDYAFRTAKRPERREPYTPPRTDAEVRAMFDRMIEQSRSPADRLPERIGKRRDVDAKE